MDRLFGLDSAALRDDEELSLLVTCYDDVLAGMYEELLKEENIPYLRKDRGAGGAVRLIMGSSSYGTDIYVPTALLAAAKDLITPPDGAEIIDEEGEGEAE